MSAVRLIIPTDSISPSDVYTFKNAAQTIKNDYLKADKTSVVSVIFVSSGREIVSAINRQPNGSIISLDVISHGNQGGIHIARKLPKPAESSFMKRNMHFQMRSNTDQPQTVEQARYMEESMHGLYTDWIAKKGVSYFYNQTYDNVRDIATLGDIDFERFAKDAFVEFHGCRTAEVIPVMNKFFRDNFAKAFSEKLSNTATVVGHVTNSNPNISASSSSSDYRHGRVNVYVGGEPKHENIKREASRFRNSSTPLVNNQKPALVD